MAALLKIVINSLQLPVFLSSFLRCESLKDSRQNKSLLPLLHFFTPICWILFSSHPTSVIESWEIPVNDKIWPCHYMKQRYWFNLLTSRNLDSGETKTYLWQPLFILNIFFYSSVTVFTIDIEFQPKIWEAILNPKSCSDPIRRFMKGR